MKSVKPNILLIMSDEHNASVCGFNGNKIIRTPNLDSLAERGVAFDNCYCNSPLCVPSRLSFTAGKYVSRIGAWSNNCELPSDDYPSLPQVLNSAGYESFLCGKQHYAATRRYGFTEIGPTYKEPKSGKGSRCSPTSPVKNNLSKRFDKFHPGDNSKVLDHDREVTKETVSFLRERGKTEKPFFLFAGYLAPHFPLIAPESFVKNYRGKIPLPVIPEGHLQSLPLNYKVLRSEFEVAQVPEEIVIKSRELYYGLTEWIDCEIGKVLQALGGTSFAENTIVIYTSDHGENMGEHGMWWKNCMFEHSSRVPLIVSWPARWKGGQRRTQACSLVDLVQTIARLGDGEIPSDWDGDPMCNWLDDEKSVWKDFALSEYYAHNIASGYSMVRTKQYKYVYHTSPDANHPPERELYDLSTDPGEFTNLANRFEYSQCVKDLHSALLKELGEDPEAIEQRCRIDLAKGYPEVIP